MVAWTQGVAEILRRHDVGDEVIGELVTLARQRLRAPLVIESEAVAA
jgi:hypothetical protein